MSISCRSKPFTWLRKYPAQWTLPPLQMSAPGRLQTVVTPRDFSISATRYPESNGRVRPEADGRRQGDAGLASPDRIQEGMYE